jgi:hypothetical protein
LQLTFGEEVKTIAIHSFVKDWMSSKCPSSSITICHCPENCISIVSADLDGSEEKEWGSILSSRRMWGSCEISNSTIRLKSTKCPWISPNCYDKSIKINYFILILVYYFMASLATKTPSSWTVSTLAGFSKVCHPTFWTPNFAS